MLFNFDTIGAPSSIERISICFRSIWLIIFDDNKHFFIDSLAANRPE
jgi:hypothetical protein